MTRNVFKSYLRKIQKLQILAYEHGLNFSFGTRGAETFTQAWITGSVYPEGTSFTNDPEGEAYIFFYFYDWRGTELWDEELARIEKFIIEHGNIAK